MFARAGHRLGLAVALVIGAFALGACGEEPAGGPRAQGGEEQSRQTEAQTEAIYLDIGGLKYQVQLSRVLNPHDVEDAEYLTGLPDEATLDPEETWFAVFMRVENATDTPATSTDRFEIVDTQENHFRPLAIDTEVNPFAYAATELGPGELQPSPTSAAGQGPVQGEMLLFRLQFSTLQNRPLQLRFRDPPTGQVGVVDLDV